jgi:O-antigen ligase
MTLIIATYSFFGYLMPNTWQYSLLVVAVIGLLFYSVLKGNKIKTEHFRIIVLLIMFASLLLILAFYSSFPDTSIKTAINISAILGVGIFLSMQSNWFENCLKYLLLFSMVHVLFTLFSYMSPDIFSKMVLPFLPSEISSSSSLFMSLDLYAGITNQIGRNSLYITVGISIMVSSIISKSKKTSIFSILMLIVMVTTLLLAGKRGPLISNILATIFLIVAYAKVQRKSIAKKILLTILAISILMLVIILIVPESATPFKRLILHGGGDITSGRSHLWEGAVELFKQKPILGWGLGSFSVFQNIGTHNVYLQLLCETGFVGTLLYVSILISILLATMKAMRVNHALHNSYDGYLLFSLYIQIFYILYSMTGNPLNDGFVLVVYIIAMSIPYSMSLPTVYKRNETYNLSFHQGRNEMKGEVNI